MASTTRISWTESTWNPVDGCSIISPGCTNCYAQAIAHRFGGEGQPYHGLTNDHGKWNGRIRFHPERLEQP